MRQVARNYDKPILEISPDTRQRLAAYEWPGNVRELRNAIEHMAVVTTDAVLGVDDLPDYIAPGEAAAPEAPQLVGMSIEDAERELIRNTLAAVSGNRVEAAKTLGIGERTLYRKIKEYDLK
jgi:two-component system response regulator HydG